MSILNVGFQNRHEKILLKTLLCIVDFQNITKENIELNFSNNSNLFKLTLLSFHCFIESVRK